MKKIIIDTDIGDDIDDALALAFAVNSPELELVGVTTVFMNAERRAKMAVKLLETYGTTNIPVVPGLDIPLIQEWPKRNEDRYDNLNRFIPCQFSEDFEKIELKNRSHAVDFIIEKVHAYPNEIILVPIGPLTNIAVAIRKDPSICRKIKSITMMGGMYKEQHPEWNIVCDPEAAWIVFTSGIKIDMIGLDVTLQCKLNRAEVAALKDMKTQSTDLLSLLIKRWLDACKVGNPILHDPLAVATLVDRSIVKFEKRHVDIQLSGLIRGCTTTRINFIEGESESHPWVEIAEAVDVVKFKEFFLGRILGK